MYTGLYKYFCCVDMFCNIYVYGTPEYYVIPQPCVEASTTFIWWQYQYFCRWPRNASIFESIVCFPNTVHYSRSLHGPTKPQARLSIPSPNHHLPPRLLPLRHPLTSPASLLLYTVYTYTPQIPTPIGYFFVPLHLTLD